MSALPDHARSPLYLAMPSGCFNPGMMAAESVGEIA